MKRILVILLLMLSSLMNAQDKRDIVEADYTNSEVPMADKLREDGKIYVLTGIILIILIGTISYLITIDRKVGRIEKQLNTDS